MKPPEKIGGWELGGDRSLGYWYTWDCWTVYAPNDDRDIAVDYSSGTRGDCLNNLNVAVVRAVARFDLTPREQRHGCVGLWIRYGSSIWPPGDQRQHLTHCTADEVLR